MELRVTAEELAVCQAEDVPENRVLELYEATLRHAIAAGLTNSAHPEAMTTGQRALFSLAWAMIWLPDGGITAIWQDHAADVAVLPASAELVGAGEFAQLFARANAALPEGALDGDDALVAALDALEPRTVTALEPLAEEYHRLDARPGASLGDIVWRYVEAHPAEFVREEAGPTEPPAARPRPRGSRRGS